MNIEAIIPTAGIGSRFKSDIPKPFVLLNDLPIIVHTLKALNQCAQIKRKIVVAHKDRVQDYKKLIEKYSIDQNVTVVIGGQTRRESVGNGLRNLLNDTDIVMIHDGVRPLIKPEFLNQLIKICTQDDAVVLGVPVKSTIKQVEENSLTVEQTLERNKLWDIQTPQVFKKDIIMKAHALPMDEPASDDAVLVEKLGIKVKVLRGDYQNIKITTNEDLKIASAFLNG